VQVGERYKQGRYVVLKKLGWGHFSTVWLVMDNQTSSFAALKARQALWLARIESASGCGDAAAAQASRPK
jgi:hypothetical protein